MTATTHDVSQETLEDVYASGVIPTAEQVAGWIEREQVERDQALTMEQAAGEAVLAADYRIALLVIVSARLDGSVRKTAERFVWLTGGSKSSSVGSRLIAVAELVRDGGGSTRWTHAWTQRISAEKATRAANKGEDVEQHRAKVAAEAGFALSTFDTISSLGSAEGVLARALAVDPTLLSAIPSSVLSAAASAARKAQAGQDGEGEPGEGADGDPVIPAIERVKAAVASLLRAIDKSDKAEHVVLTSDLAQDLEDAHKGMLKARNGLKGRTVITVKVSTD